MPSDRLDDEGLYEIERWVEKIERSRPGATGSGTMDVALRHINALTAEVRRLHEHAVESRADVEALVETADSDRLAAAAEGVADAIDLYSTARQEAAIVALVCAVLGLPEVGDGG